MSLESAEYVAALPRKRMGAGVLFVDDQARALLVEPTYKNYWEFPGGAVEADESPYSAAQREIREELGLSVRPGRLLVVDWVPPHPGRTEGVMFIYDGGELSADQAATIKLPADELRSWAWCTRREADTRLSDLLARRAAAARTARTEGATIYLEDGYPIA